MPNDILKLKRLMYAANYLRKNDPVILRGNKLTSSGALKYAWWFEDFRNKLRTGVWRFSYFKKEGDIREAVGTLDMERIPKDQRPISGIDPEAMARKETFCYFDLGISGWRSFCLDLFIGFVQEVE